MLDDSSTADQVMEENSKIQEADTSDVGEVIPVTVDRNVALKEDTQDKVSEVSEDVNVDLTQILKIFVIDHECPFDS